MFTSSKPKSKSVSHKKALSSTDSGQAHLDDLDAKDRQRATRQEVAAAKAKHLDLSASSSSSPTPGGGLEGGISPNEKQKAALATISSNQAEEDDALDELSDVLGTLKEQSQVMSAQLKQHNQIIDGLEHKVDHTSERIRKGTRTMKKIT
jgi:synaptosomal-associated protein 25